MFITVLAFPTLLFVALSRSPSLAADSGNAVAGQAPSLLGRGSNSADIELPHELPTPDDDAHHKKTLNQIADLVTGARHTVYEFKTKSLADGKDVSLSEFKNNVAIVVNVASNCGYTDVHYRELEALYKKYKDRGFTVLAFPSNDFGNQEPGTPAEIVKFARETKHASFPLLEKVHVNGKESHALFAFLKDKFGMKEIPWNFQKFLIDRNGHPVHQYPSQIDPMALENDILKLLAA